MNKINVNGYEVFLIRGGFNVIRALDGSVWMYCLTAWDRKFKIYPPDGHRASVTKFDTEELLFDYVRRFDKGKPIEKGGPE